MKKKLFLTIVILMLVLIISLIVSLCFGSELFTPKQIFDIFANKSEDYESVILFDVRMPRILLAAIAGACLAVSGTIFQGILKNPLADPYITGTSSGAALGATVAIVLNLSILPTLLFAFLGSTIIMLCVYLFSLKQKRISVETFLLSGVIAGAFCSSLVSLLMTVSGNDMHKIVWWLMGSLSGREEWDYVLFILACFIIGFSIVLYYSPHINLLSMGENIAKSKGIDTERLKLILISSGCLLTAGAVSVCGTIGFVGFMIPHIMRGLFGGDHRILMVSSALGGAIFLMLADTVSRSLFAPSELPCGVITALCGVPLFFFVLKKMR